jgi:hypothetical protein
MVPLSRIANNALGVAIIFGFFYVIYMNAKGNDVFAKIKDKMGGKLNGGNNR